MDIQSLKLVVTDADANQLLAEFAPKELEVEKVQIAFTPAGVLVTGDTAALLFKVSFETLWELSVVEGHVVARLSSLKVAGIPAGKLRGVILKVLRDAVPQQPGITVQDEMVRVDVNQLLKSQAIPLRVLVTAVRCGAGTVIIEV